MELDHRRVVVADSATIKVYGYSHDIQVQSGKDAPTAHSDCLPFQIVSYDINRRSEESKSSSVLVVDSEWEELTFVDFLSDSDPSFLVALTYNATRQCSYLKLLKIYNQIEQEDDWLSNKNQADLDDKSYSMVEDESKEILIGALKANLEQQPAVNSKNAQF